MIDYETVLWTLVVAGLALLVVKALVAAFVGRRQ